MNQNYYKAVRTRFAPSPTGSLHIAGVRNALYCYALAKKYNGQFVVRIEDTDQNRLIKESIEEIFKVLQIFNLTPDESIVHGGKYGPYIQSERIDIYKKYINFLLEKGHAYYCFLSKSDLEDLQKTQRGKGFRSPYRYLETKEIEKLLREGREYVIRLKVPENEKIEFIDEIQGKIVFDTSVVGDEILIKSNGYPSYHFAVVVDDYEMKISHVIRSIEWLPSTPKQILLYRYLDLPMPVYAHPPVILDPSGGKLSKRKGTVAALKFIEEGYLPEALMNFVMMLGWAPPIVRKHGEKEREIFSITEFISLFELKDINKSNPVFNRDKLVWFNQEYIKNLDVDNLTNKFVHWIKLYRKNIFKEDINIISDILKDTQLKEKIFLVQTRSKTLEEIFLNIKFFYVPPNNLNLFEIEQLRHFLDKLEDVYDQILKLHQSFPNSTKEWVNEDWVKGMKEISKKNCISVGDSFMLLRVLVVGKPYSPPLFESLVLMNKNEIINRLNKFNEYIKK